MIARPFLFFAGAFALLVAIDGAAVHLAAGFRQTLAAQTASTRSVQHRIDEAKDDTAQLAAIAAAMRRAPPDSGRPVNVTGPVDPGEVARWLERVKKLRQAFADRPAQKIPQLALLSDREWVELARTADLDTGEGLARALSAARTAAKSRFSGLLFGALQEYLKANGNELPTDLTDLLSYFEADSEMPARPDAAMLAQYELTASGKIADAPDGVILKEKAVVDERFDQRTEIIRGDDGSLAFRTHAPPADFDIEGMLDRAVRAFAEAHQGAAPTDAEDLIPFLHGPLRQVIVQALARNPQQADARNTFQERVAKILSTPVAP
ncbi:MAG TPA: hypothetical protein VHD62_18900 [Opitutaceae bacterium]|nr:hypothetical protein [Opitutaceae bacterium]